MARRRHIRTARRITAARRGGLQGAQGTGERQVRQPLQTSSQPKLSAESPQPRAALPPPFTLRHRRVPQADRQLPPDKHLRAPRRPSRRVRGSRAQLPSPRLALSQPMPAHLLACLSCGFPISRRQGPRRRVRVSGVQAAPAGAAWALVAAQARCPPPGPRRPARRPSPSLRFLRPSATASLTHRGSPAAPALRVCARTATAAASSRPWRPGGAGPGLGGDAPPLPAAALPSSLLGAAPPAAPVRPSKLLDMAQTLARNDLVRRCASGALQTHSAAGAAGACTASSPPPRAAAPRVSDP